MTVCVLGSINLDTVLQTGSLPIPGQTIIAHTMSEHLGGKGANQAVAAARMGAETIFVGATGQDAAGRRLRLNLASAGVDVSQLVELSDYVSGRAFINVAASGENSIVVASGANSALQPNHVSGLAQGARVLLTQLETPLNTIASLLSGHKASGTIRILNAAPALPGGRDLFGLLDIIIVNETELMAYAGLRCEDQAVGRLAEAAACLISRPDQRVITTLGSAGAAIIGNNQVAMIPGRRVQTVDTTGAGDCFCGVLAAELDGGADLDAAVFAANAAAALSVTRLGAATSSPTRAELEVFLRAI